jgi:hypothetical protein
MPRGGRRPGSGRKPKSAYEKAITGNPGKRGTVLQHPSAPPAAAPPPSVDTFEPPKYLPLEAQLVWVELAAHAVKVNTLKAGTLAAFEMLCCNVVLERKYRSSPLGAGGPDHRGMIQRVNAQMKDFALSPFGKAIHEGASEEADKPMSPLERLLSRKRGGMNG